VVSLILSAAVITLVLGPRQPSYRGKALSQYLTAFSDDGCQISSEPPYAPVGVFVPSTERTEAWEALDHFGDEAIPILVKLASARDSTPARFLHWLASKVPWLNLRSPTDLEKQRQAVAAFIRYGSWGAPAVPQLLPLLHDRHTARAAIYSLAFINPEGEIHVLALADAIQSFDGQPVLKIDVIATLGACGPKAAKAAPVLTRCLSSTNDQVSAMAAVALSRIGEKTPEAAALIAGRLSNSSRGPAYVAPPREMYLWALGEFGPVAEGALPILAGFTNDVSGRVRHLAEDAIRRIEGAVERDAPH
jgi:HEAT repeat protein